MTWQVAILSQLAGAFAHLDELGYRLFDIHPLNVLVEPGNNNNNNNNNNNGREGAAM